MINFIIIFKKKQKNNNNEKKKIRKNISKILYIDHIFIVNKTTTKKKTK